MKSIHIVFIFLFLINVLKISAQSVEGRITDGESGAPLENVNIQSVGYPHRDKQRSKRSLSLKTAGRRAVYTLYNDGWIQAGKNYRKRKSGFPETNEYDLYPSVLQIKPIEVTAQKYRNIIDSPKLESPALNKTAISVVKKDEIQKQGRQNTYGIDAVYSRRTS